MDTATLPLYELRYPIRIRAIRCEAVPDGPPCRFGAYKHVCGHWLIFDEDGRGYHDEIPDDKFQRDYKRARK